MVGKISLAISLLWLGASAFSQPQDPPKLPESAIPPVAPIATPVQPELRSVDPGLQQADLDALKKEAAAIPNVQGQSNAAPDQTMATDGDISYYIKDGKVYQKNNAAGTSTLLSAGWLAGQAKDILVFKGQLISLRDDEQIFVWNSADKEWIKIGNEAEQICATDEYLVALSHSYFNRKWSRSLWIYKGQPKNGIALRVVPRVSVPSEAQMTPDSAGPMTVAPIFGRVIAFYESKVTNVLRMQPVAAKNGGHDILIYFSDGTARLFSSLDTQPK